MWTAQVPLVGFRPVEPPAQLRVNPGLLQLLEKHTAGRGTAQGLNVQLRSHFTSSGGLPAKQVPQQAAKDVKADQRAARPRHPTPPPRQRPADAAAQVLQPAGSAGKPARQSSKSPQLGQAVAGRRASQQHEAFIKAS